MYDALGGRPLRFRIADFGYRIEIAYVATLLFPQSAIRNLEASLVGSVAASGDTKSRGLRANDERRSNDPKDFLPPRI
jgi:hypothetical protein